MVLTIEAFNKVLNFPMFREGVYSKGEILFQYYFFDFFNVFGDLHMNYCLTFL